MVAQCHRWGTVPQMGHSARVSDLNQRFELWSVFCTFSGFLPLFSFVQVGLLAMPKCPRCVWCPVMKWHPIWVVFSPCVHERTNTLSNFLWFIGKCIFCQSVQGEESGDLYSGCVDCRRSWTCTYFTSVSESLWLGATCAILSMEPRWHAVCFRSCQVLLASSNVSTLPFWQPSFIVMLFAMPYEFCFCIFTVSDVATRCTSRCVQPATVWSIWPSETWLECHTQRKRLRPLPRRWVLRVFIFELVCSACSQEAKVNRHN